MNKYSFFFCPYFIAFMIFAFESSCQDIDTGKVIHHNKIDDITNSKEIQKLLLSMDSDFKKFTVNEWLKFSDPECARMGNDLKIKAFEKADFDGNGWMDLLLIGRLYDHMIICIMDSGQNHFFYRVLTKKSFQDCTFPVVERDNGVSFVDYYGRNQPTDWKVPDTTTRWERKRLIYLFNDFVEYNAKVRDFHIEQIEYSTTMCFGTCPVFSLSINKDRTAEYDAKQFNKESGEFAAVIDEKHFTELMQLVNYIDFPKLKDHYSVSWTDDQTSILVITYDGGKQKKIIDYGLMGTFGLSRLYDLLFDLRNNQQWKK